MRCLAVFMIDMDEIPGHAQKDTEVGDADLDISHTPQPRHIGIYQDAPLHYACMGNWDSER